MKFCKILTKLPHAFKRSVSLKALCIGQCQMRNMTCIMVPILLKPNPNGNLHHGPLEAEKRFQVSR